MLRSASGWGISAVCALSLGVVFVLAPIAARAAQDSTVLATVGNHKITEKDVDSKIKPQMAALESKIFDLKRDAIQSIADNYLIEQAARREKLSVPEYIKKEITDKTPKVTEADARRYFDAHKGKSKVQYDQIKDRLLQMMQEGSEQEQREKVLADLRKSEPLKIMIQPPRIQVASIGRPVRGPADAPVTIIEFSDFQCPFCKRAEPIVEEVLKKYGDKVRLVYVDFPLPMHSNALDAAKAGQCAAQQGKFWPFHDQLFADQSKLAPADLKATAKRLGLDTAKFDTCFDEAKTEATVRKELAEGQRLGIDGTPTFYIDGRQLVGAQPVDSFSEIIDQDLSQPEAAVK